MQVVQRYDKAAVQRSFDKASSSYVAHNQVQSQVAHHLLHACKSSVAKCATLLDLGCGPGVNTRSLTEISESYIGLDLSANMLAMARQRTCAEHLAAHAQFIHADMDNLPLANDCVDVIYSSLAIQWSANPRGLVKQLERVLKPGGQAFLATLLEGTLEPLRSLRYQIDGMVQGNPQPRFELWLDALNECSDLAIVDSQIKTYQVFSPDLPTLLMGIKGVGAGAAARADGESHSRALSISVYRRLARHYETYRSPQGLPLNYQVGFMTLKKSNHDYKIS